jgi:eukaryotic-like serine/threonine-protein kinase
MTPARWRQIETLFDAALELEPARRREFLAAACIDDEALRGEVERLLACNLQAGQFLESPALEAAERPSETEPRPPAQLACGEQLGPYRIVAPLASGGMGEVYSATDTRLDRAVAVKLLPRQFTQDAQALKRFRREAQAVSALNHPNICTLYDIGEHEGQPFLVLELLEGQSLKERLAAGPLPSDELLALGVQIARGIEAAHAKGIVHRDIKPANVIVTRRGEAKILDFGLAKLLTEPTQSRTALPARTAGAPPEGTISLPGWTPGTLAYMSPEQTRGEPVDERTDLFSLGVTLYEMATGTKPFRGESPALVRKAVLAGAPAAPRVLNASLPARLERVILKALEKDRTARYQSAEELRTDLERARAARPHARRWLLAAAVAVVVVVGGFLAATRTGGNWIRGRSPVRPEAVRPVAATPIHRLAVLPLRNLSGGPDQDLVAEGIGDAIAADLATLTGLRVISRSSAIQFRQTEKRTSEIARELAVDLVIAGSADVSRERLEVRLNLTRAGSDAPFWAETFHGDYRATRAIRREVARAVALEIQVRGSPGKDPLTIKEGTASRAAFENYVRGRHYLEKRTDSDIQRAVAFFKEAIDTDPAYAAAYAGLADCYNQFATVAVGRPPGENRRLAIASAKKAIEIDDLNAEAHAALGYARLYNWDWAGADVELTRALDLNPSYASAHVWKASSLVIRRLFDEAVAEVDRAGELDPLSPITQTQVGWIRSLAGRTEEATAQVRKVLGSHPDYPWAMWQLGGNLIESGQAREAVGILEKAVAVSKNNPAFLGALGRAYAQSGNRRGARQILSRLKEMSRDRYVTPNAPADVCLGLGDWDCFFDALEEGYRQRINYMAYLSIVPLPARYGAVRGDPRFQDLLRRLGYEN